MFNLVNNAREGIAQFLFPFRSSEVVREAVAGACDPILPPDVSGNSWSETNFLVSGSKPKSGLAFGLLAFVDPVLGLGFTGCF